ncbi:hypothetical protein LCGC14_2871440 [marine sediment metagenome]|uniref:Uncharacterized protein n=1 Tax=marine sediment metagenome TaxID=412755 RepID=A0A0F8Y320_9ZZZZ
MSEKRYTIKELEEKELIFTLDEIKKGTEYKKRLLKYMLDDEKKVSFEWLEDLLKKKKHCRYCAGVNNLISIIRKQAKRRR